MAKSGPGRPVFTVSIRQGRRRSLKVSTSMQKPLPESVSALRTKSPSLSPASAGDRHEPDATSLDASSGGAASEGGADLWEDTPSAAGFGRMSASTSLAVTAVWGSAAATTSSTTGSAAPATRSSGPPTASSVDCSGSGRGRGSRAISAPSVESMLSTFSVVNSAGVSDAWGSNAGSTLA